MINPVTIGLIIGAALSTAILLPIAIWWDSTKLDLIDDGLVAGPRRHDGKHNDDT